MMNITISDLDIFAYHGVYEQERRSGQAFQIQCEIGFEPPGDILSLDQTIDYTHVINMIREIMSTPEDLLETVAFKITERIRTAPGGDSGRDRGSSAENPKPQNGER